MDDRILVTRLLEIGVAARRRNPESYAEPSDDANFRDISVATIAHWLEELGRHRMIGSVQPCFTNSGAGFEFQVTEEAMRLMSDTSKFNTWLNTIVPPRIEFDVFVSYAVGDSAVANELRDDLERNGLRCFMAEKDIHVAAEWQDSIRAALVGSKQILVLLTPRSISRPWVLMEIGAAWVLEKALIPALSHVAVDELLDPIRRYQARVIETTAQRRVLVDELVKACN